MDLDSVNSRGPVLLAKSSFCASGDIWEWSWFHKFCWSWYPGKIQLRFYWSGRVESISRVGSVILSDRRAMRWRPTVSGETSMQSWDNQVESRCTPSGLKSKDLEAFKFLYQEYDKDNKWQSENTGLSSFLKQEARQTAFWYIFKLWSWLHFIMKKKQCAFFKAEAKKVHAIVSSLHPICRGLY